LSLDVPQTEEARTEALELMSVKHNLVTPRNGEPVIAAIQDFITASFLLSRKDLFLDRRQFTQICCYFADANMQIDIPPPTIWKPVRLWTGKQVFNVLMRPNRDSNIKVNVESKCHKWEEAKKENYPGIASPANDLSPNDGWLVIVNSEIMCGVMDKATVGSGKKKSIFGVIMRDYGPHEAAAAMNRLAKLCARWLGMYSSIYFAVWLTHTVSQLRVFVGDQRRYSWAGAVAEEGYARREGVCGLSGCHRFGEEGET
jgi:DNA-directed RNA polymerase III subunit RPC1